MNTVSLDVRAAVVAREAGCCAACGRSCVGRKSSVHHRRTKGMGGSSLPDTNQPVNLLLLCGDGVSGCHGFVTKRRHPAEEMGWRVAQGSDPAEVPVWTARSGWVLLTPDGGYEPCDDPHPAETAALEAVSLWLLDRT